MDFAATAPVLSAVPTATAHSPTLSALELVVLVAVKAVVPVTVTVTVLAALVVRFVCSTTMEDWVTAVTFPKARSPTAPEVRRPPALPPAPPVPPEAPADGAAAPVGAAPSLARTVLLVRAPKPPVHAPATGAEI